MYVPSDEVATSVTANALEAVEALRWPIQPDWAAAGLDPVPLRSPRGWVSWEDYLRFLGLLAGPGAGPETHARLGALIMSHSVGGPIRHFGRLVDGAGPLFRLVYGSILGSTITVVRASVTADGPHRLRIRLELDPRLAPGEVFFHSVVGTMRRLPNLLGSPDALIEARISPHEAVYDVQLLPGRSVLSRFGRAWRVVTGTQDVTSSVELLLRVDEAVRNLRDAEERLGEAEERWRQLASGVPGLVVVVDAGGVVIGAHGSAARPATLVPGRPWSEVFVPEDRAAVVQQLVQADQGAPIEVRAGAPSGGDAWWTCRAAALSGSPPRRVVVALDVTERRHTEEVLRETERRFLHAQKLEAIGRLSGGLAHDLNNVLTAILANADLLEAPVARSGGATTPHDPLRGIRDAVGRASALTRRLLAAGRPRAPGAKTSDLSALCRDAQAVLSRLVGETVRLRVDVPDLPVLVRIEEDRVEQILLNLVVNARDALPSGGVIAVRVEESGPRATLLVSDDGIGMSEEVLARATEPFFTTKPVGLGSGLGLSTVRDLVVAAGGELRIHSAPGGGTTIRITLPTTEEEHADDRRQEETPGRLDGAGRHVLLVEDQDDVRDLVAENLRRIGFRVTPCSGGEAALRLFGSDPDGFDLLVTDLVMPGIGGRDLARAIRDTRPELPILLMSGYAEPDESTIAGTGRVDFLAKPFRVSGLAAAVKALVGAPEAGATS